jgi:hypothetical protein
MAKRTLLDMTQDILSVMDSDSVNSISDTVESEQVANLLKTTYFDMIFEMDLPHTGTLFSLTASGSSSKPSHMLIPDDVMKILWIKYDVVDSGDTASKYRDVTYMNPIDFITMCAMRDEDDTDNISSITDYSGVELLINKTQDPRFWTSFDDEHIVFDAYDSTVDSTLQASKVICHGYKEEEWTHEDDAIPDLPSNLFPMLVAEAKSTALALWKEPNQKIEQRARRMRVRSQRNKWRENGGHDGPHYGRK